MAMQTHSVVLGRGGGTATAARICAAAAGGLAAAARIGVGMRSSLGRASLVSRSSIALDARTALTLPRCRSSARRAPPLACLPAPDSSNLFGPVKKLGDGLQSWLLNQVKKKAMDSFAEDLVKLLKTPQVLINVTAATVTGLFFYLIENGWPDVLLELKICYLEVTMTKILLRRKTLVSLTNRLRSQYFNVVEERESWYVRAYICRERGAEHEETFMQLLRKRNSQLLIMDGVLMELDKELTCLDVTQLIMKSALDELIRMRSIKKKEKWGFFSTNI